MSSHALALGAALLYVLALSLTDPFSYTSSTAQQLQADCLSWIILYAIARYVLQASPNLFGARPRSVTGNGHALVPPTNQLLRSKVTEPAPDILAMAFAAVCLLRAVAHAYWAVPLLTPLLLLHQLHSARPDDAVTLPLHGTEKEDIRTAHWASRARLLNLLPHIALSIAAACMLLPLPIHWANVSAGIAQVGYLFYIFNALHGRTSCSGTTDTTTLADRTVPMLGVAWRTAMLLGMMLLLTSCPISLCPSLFIAALAKALTWLAMYILIDQDLILPLSALMTFAIASFRACIYDTPTVPVSLSAAVALIGLVQFYRCMPKFAYGRLAMLLLAGLVILVALARHANPSMREYRSTSPFLPRLFKADLHPVEILVRDANAQFEALVNRQSTTLEAATLEYQRRYKRPPPYGFDEWFKLAMESKSAIIDDFDAIMQPLEPFWGLTPQEIRLRAQLTDVNPFALFTVRNNTIAVPKNTLVLGYFDRTITRWMERFRHLLPDMDFAVNGLAEPRVFVPHDELNHLVHNCPSEEDWTMSKSGDNGAIRHELQWMDLGRKNSWQICTKSCPEDSPSRSVMFKVDNHTSDIPFVLNATREKDWCEQPEASISHAMFVAPFNLKITSTLIPMFSHGKPNLAQDILYPSPDYDVNMDENAPPKYFDNEDPPWEQKQDGLYWAGSDTGGFARRTTWRHFHRQRFVSVVNDGSLPQKFLHDVKPSIFSPHRWSSYTAPFGNLTEYMNVHFTSLDACEGTACVEEESELPVAESDSRSTKYNYKLLFDIDGMGRTERFYRLLGSRSAVLKQTMHTEWHDDRLVPWVHYIPVSLGMEELPELLRFLLTTESGGKVAAKVAQRGREWHQQALRDVDLELAMGRLLLEYGRLVSEEREINHICRGE